MKKSWSKNAKNLVQQSKFTKFNDNNLSKNHDVTIVLVQAMDYHRFSSSIPSKNRHVCVAEALVFSRSQTLFDSGSFVRSRVSVYDVVPIDRSVFKIIPLMELVASKPTHRGKPCTKTVVLYVVFFSFLNCNEL